MTQFISNLAQYRKTTGWQSWRSDTLTHGHHTSMIRVCFLAVDSQGKERLKSWLKPRMKPVGRSQWFHAVDWVKRRTFGLRKLFVKQLENKDGNRLTQIHSPAKLPLDISVCVHSVCTLCVYTVCTLCVYSDCSLTTYCKFTRTVWRYLQGSESSSVQTTNCLVFL